MDIWAIIGIIIGSGLAGFGLMSLTRLIADSILQARRDKHELLRDVKTLKDKVLSQYTYHWEWRAKVESDLEAWKIKHEDELNEKFNITLGSLEEDVDRRIDEVNTTLRLNEDLYSVKLANWETHLDKKIEDEVDALTEVVNQLDSELNKDLDATQGRLSKSIADERDRRSKAINAVKEELTKKIEKETESQLKLVKHVGAKVDEEIATLREEANEAEGRREVMLNAISDVVGRLDGEVQRLFEVLIQRIEGTEKKLDEIDEALVGTMEEVEGQQASVGDVVKRLDTIEAVNAVTPKAITLPLIRMDHEESKVKRAEKTASLIAAEVAASRGDCA